MQDSEKMGNLATELLKKLTHLQFLRAILQIGAHQADAEGCRLEASAWTSRLLSR